MPGGGWRRVTAEASLLALVLLVFARLHAVVATDVATATSNALTVQSAEQVLHLNIELATNRWLTEHGALIPPAVLLYRGYYAVLLGVLIWAYTRHSDIYLRARRTLVVMGGLALLVFWVVPTSPPRFAQPGIVDIVAEHDLLAAQPSPDMSSSANLTAMPSLHVAWSAWCAYVLWSAYRKAHPRAALFAWLFPLAMVADVLATGNHDVLDIGGSAVLLIASIAVVTGWARLADGRLSSLV